MSILIQKEICILKDFVFALDVYGRLCVCVHAHTCVCKLALFSTQSQKHKTKSSFT